MTIPVFDGHNDFLLRLLRDPDRREATWLGDGEAPTGHLDLPRMRAGGFGGGLFAIYVPSPDGRIDMDALMDSAPYDLPLPEPLEAGHAQAVAMAMAGHLMWMERAAGGAFALCRDADAIEACLADGTVVAVMHMEGAEAIGPDLDALHLWHAMGLRSLGPVWSRPTAFGHGVPFRFPSTGDTGPGLTAAGEALVRECDALRMLIDLSHITEAGFWDVARLSQAPLVASHSNAHAVTPSSRNLTDTQLDAVAERGGLVGLNFATGFLRPDGLRGADMGWDPVLRHLDHLIGRLGEGGVGFGSDFDGATVPRGIGDAAGLPRLIEALRGHGYDEALLTRLCHGNWLRVLRAVWER
jgi:membrane dipeptidase